MEKKRSPLPSAPVRNPGQSVSERIQDVFFDKLLPPVMIAAFLLGVVPFVWIAKVSKPSTASAAIFTVVAMGAAVWAWRRYSSVKEEIANLKLGRDGEMWVAQFLEANRDDGWRLLSDLPAPGFNVDHVLITSRGIFAIETKTFSKTAGVQSKAVFDGQRILFNGRGRDRDPVSQARAQRDWVRDFLHETTGSRFPVKAVVLLPGWYVEGPANKSATDVWVLNPKALPAFVRHEHECVDPADVALVVSRLANLSARPEWSS